MAGVRKQSEEGKMIRATRTGYRSLLGLELGVFTDDDLSELHNATLEVLADTGLMVLNDEAREIFYSHGCEVDKRRSIVRIPPHLVDEAIESVPSRLLLAGRSPKNDIILGGNRVLTTDFAVAIQILDLETRRVRESTRMDLAESAILCDALDGVDGFFLSMSPRDVPPEVVDLVEAEVAFTNTGKHFTHGEVLTAEGVKSLFEMAVVIAGSAEEVRRRPPLSIIVCPVSPLQLGPECCEVVIESARLGIPCSPGTMVLAGATAPVTLAGALIVHNAEALGGIVLGQLTKKGAPAVYCSSTTIMDLAVINAPVGAPDFGLLMAAIAKLAQYYNLPSFIAGA